MENFSKMVEAYRWRGEDTKKHHRDSCASLSASPAQAIHNAVGEQANVCCFHKTNAKDCSSSPNTSCILINRSFTDPANAGHNVHRQTNQYEAKSCVSDGDDGMGGQGTLDRAVSYSSGSYNSGRHCHLRKKPRPLSRGLSSRQLVFGAEDADAKCDMKGRVKSSVKRKRERKKSGQIQAKQRETAIPSIHGPELYDDSACEDGPIEVFSPDTAYSPVVASSQPSHFKASNAPASNIKKWRTAPSTKCVAHQHVLMNGKSPYFAYVKLTPSSKSAKKIKNSLSSTLLEDKTAEVNVYTRRRKKASPVLSKDTIEIDEGKESSGHLTELSDCKDRNADTSEEVETCGKAAALPSKATSAVKTSAYFTAVPKALGQRDIANKTWVPPISVYTLIQEELYRDPWKVLVACMLLNKTCGSQMRKIIWDLFAICPTPEAAVAVETEKIEDVIWPLGLQKKRARMIQKFSKDYLGKEWVNVGQLHGIGKYATDAYAIFCEGRWREVKPEDHKLVDYWQYLCATDGLGYAFKDDREKGCEVVCTVSQVES